MLFLFSAELNHQEYFSFAEQLCSMEQKSSNEVFGLVCLCCGQVQVKSLAVFSVCFSVLTERKNERDELYIFSLHPFV